MGTIFTALGWLAAVILIAAAASSAARARWRGWRKGTAAWVTVLPFASLASAALALLGAVGPLAGALLAAVPAAVLGIILWRGSEPSLYVLRWHLARGAGYLARDGRWLAGRLRGGRLPWPRRADGGGDIPAPPARDGGPVRAVPSLREDPALGDAPPPADIGLGLLASGVPVPALWAALCEATASFEPDTDEDLIAHVSGEAAGILCYAEAVRDRAETLLHGTGLDPAYVAGHHEFADEFADLAQAVALLDGRFTIIYGALREWADEHPEGMPHNARGFLQGGTPPQAGDGGVAA